MLARASNDRLIRVDFDPSIIIANKKRGKFKNKQKKRGVKYAKGIRTRDFIIAKAA